MPPLKDNEQNRDNSGDQHILSHCSTGALVEVVQLTPFVEVAVRAVDDPLLPTAQNNPSSDDQHRLPHDKFTGNPELLVVHDPDNPVDDVTDRGATKLAVSAQKIPRSGDQHIHLHGNAPIPVEIVQLIPLEDIMAASSVATAQNNRNSLDQHTLSQKKSLALVLDAHVET